MDLAEYAAQDATGLARPVKRREVSPRELAQTALKAIKTVNPEPGAVNEIYADRIANVVADGGRTRRIQN